MDKRLLLLLVVFGFIYLHKMQKLLKLTKVETHCQSHSFEGEEMVDCVSCLNIETLPVTTFRLAINNINHRHEEVYFYGKAKVLKQDSCIQYTCNELLTNDFSLEDITDLMKELDIRLDKDIAVKSLSEDLIYIKKNKGEAGLVLRTRLVMPQSVDTSTFVTVRYPKEEIEERLAISLIGAAIPGLNWILLLAFLPGLEGIMQGYMVWQILQPLTKYKLFPIMYSAVYFALSHFSGVPVYWELYLLCNILLGIVTAISRPDKLTLLSLIVTLICTST